MEKQKSEPEMSETEQKVFELAQQTAAGLLDLQLAMDDSDQPMSREFRMRLKAFREVLSDTLAIDKEIRHPKRRSKYAWLEGLDTATRAERRIFWRERNKGARRKE